MTENDARREPQKLVTPKADRGADRIGMGCGRIDPLQWAYGSLVSGASVPTMAEPVEREIGRWFCSAEEGRGVWVVEHQFFAVPETDQPQRHHPGARRLALTTGEPVRYIDGDTFEVVETGELIVRTR